MSKNPYEILGVPATATREQIDEQYYILRDKYRLDMHQEGDRGRQAAKKLQELEDAYRDIIIEHTGDAEANSNANQSESNGTISGEPEIGGTASNSATDPVFAEVEALIRNKQFTEAQHALDNISERSAEWHFYQSAIYYKQGWLNESKNQLQIACNMEPSNTKYSNSLNKLNQKMSGNGGNAQSQQNITGSSNGYSRSYGGNEYDARKSEDACCQACQCAMCTHCLCDCCCRG